MLTWYDLTAVYVSNLPSFLLYLCNVDFSNEIRKCSPVKLHQSYNQQVNAIFNFLSYIMPLHSVKWSDLHCGTS